MKYLALLILLLSGPAWNLLTWVHERNAAVAEGAAAYRRGDASRAALSFEAALAARAKPVPDPRLLLNLGHAQVQAGQAAAAQYTYGRLLVATPAALSSVARQQLAILAAQRGEIAQALNLLRQALLLDPQNGGARYNYEVLSQYLAQRPNTPKIPPPPSGGNGTKPSPDKDKKGPEKNQSGEKAGTDHQGQANDPAASPTPPTGSPDRRPSASGQADNQRPGTGSGKGTGGLQPGNGAPRPLASSDTPGSQRGLDRNSAAADSKAAGRSTRPGIDDATPADLRLQTQRERLRAMNLSPAQARQLLETLRAEEQQYLQQLTRPPAQKSNPNQPTW